MRIASVCIVFRSWACLLAAALAACGGGGEPAAATTAGATAFAGPATVIPPLLNDDGSAAPIAAGTEPADPGARTRAGRYASPAQARQLADALRDDALQIEVGCCGADAVEQAVGIAWGLQAAHDLPPQTPVLVRGDDLRLAAAAANRLADGGLTHVWLVTP
ncbi:MAG: hypothetical protein QM750_12335 [Rubrivivax sp.]